MKKFLLPIIILVIIVIIIGGVLVWENFTKKEAETSKEISMPKNLEGKKIAMIVAFRDFRDEEYFIPKEVLEKSGAEIKTVSTEKGTAVGSQGGEAEVDIKLTDLNVSDFDAIVFIGGSGAPKYLDNEISYQIAREAVSQGKILAAICISPTILAKAGVLSGKKATVWSSPLDKSAIKILEQNSVVYQKDSVVVDGRIVTADGPTAAEQFGKKLVETLDRNLAI